MDAVDEAICAVVRDLNDAHNRHASRIGQVVLDRSGSLRFSQTDRDLLYTEGRAVATAVVGAGLRIETIRYPASPQLVVDLKKSIAGYAEGSTALKQALDTGLDSVVDYTFLAAIEGIRTGREALDAVNEEVLRLDAAGVLICPGGPIIPGTGAANASATASAAIVPTPSPLSSNEVVSPPTGGVAVGDQIITVKGVETWPGEDLFRPSAGYVYVTVQVEVKAIRESYIYVLGVELRDAAGVTYSALFLPTRKPFLGDPSDLAAGQSRAGYLTFELPSAAASGGLTLLYPPDALGHPVPIALGEPT